MDSKSSSGAYDSLNTPYNPRPVTFNDDNELRSQSGLFCNGESVEPNVKLLPYPFLAVVLASNGALIGFMILFLSEVTVGSTISDSVGSSKNADNMVATYQVMNGYITAAAGEFLNLVFIVAIITYFGNLPWHPGQDPREGRDNVKRIVLWWFTPFIMYVINAGITAINIKSKIVGVEHIFVQDDLVTSFISMEHTDWADDAQNSILRTAVRSEETPFFVISDSQCLLSDTWVVMDNFKLKTIQASKMPTVKNIDSLAVEYGFITNTWNRDALPFALDPIYSVNFTVNNPTFDEFAAFQEDTGFDFLTGYEMFLQGKTLFERSVSDASVSAEYPCSWVDGKSDNELENQYATFDDNSQYAGMRKCNGAISSLQSLANIADPSTHNLESFVNSIMDGMDTTLNQTTKISIDETTFRFETYFISQQLNVTMLTLDIPLDSSIRYQNTSEDCSLDGTFTGDQSLYTEAQLSQLNAQYCDPAYYVFNQPAATCGSTNCIFLDDSGVTPYKKQILLLPYLKDCSVVNMTYGSDYLNFLPHGCEPQNDSVFLYGSGAYLSGDAYNFEEYTFPYISNPRRHLVFSFAKLDWRMEDVSKMFNAGCDVVGGCSGLVHELSNGTNESISVLVVGNSTIPAERMAAGFINPVQLVMLNAPPMLYPETYERRMWEYLDFHRFSSFSWDLELEGVQCSVLVHSYITQVKRNRYYLDDPRQAMYTSALFYLFQDAAIKNVTIGNRSVDDGSFYLGSSIFAGDKERKKIRFSIPMSSFIATFVGIVIVIVLSVVVIVTPIDRVKTSKETNFAARYAALLTNEEYPSEVHNCELITPKGDQILMEECVVKSIILQSQSDETNRVFVAKISCFDVARSFLSGRMDRISTAPVPKSKKWLKNGSNSSLLRHPSGQVVVAPLIPVSARPHSRLAPKLTPQLHWNLNNSALKTLSNPQVEQLYGLFKFYESSTAGDELPSMNCARFLDILRDARLLDDTSSSEPTKELQVDSVERIFAQAVMGKMRAYLDADGQPALTFSQFCGALMNCAMLWFPSLHPEKALREFIPILMENSVDRGYQVAIGTGLISHIPVEGKLSMWTPEDSYSGNQYDEESEQDFRDLLPFQQVIADCEDDLIAEELKQENLIQRYKIPDRLVASFQPDTLALISRKFHTFDVFDRGTVPRQEVFALLSSLGRCSDLPDPYAIVARLSTFDTPPQRDSDPGYEELSLTQLLQVIEVTREAKRHSATAQLSAIKIRMDRAATVARESIESASSFLQLSMESNTEVADVPAMRKVSRQTKRGSSKAIDNYGDRGRRPSVMSLKSRKPIVPQGNAPANSSTNSLSSKVHKGESKTQIAAVPGRKKTLHQRSPSSVSIRLDSSITDVEGEYDPMQSHRSTIERESSNNNDRAEDDDRPTITVEVYEPANATNMKTIRIFLLLGGEHDGAICCIMSLTFATRELTETEGIYYSTAPNEITRTTPVLPKQNSLMNALRMLKKRVLVKLDEGYEQRPVNQLNLVDDLLRTLHIREPHFRSPITRSSRDRPTTVPCTSELRLLTLSPMGNQCRFIASAPSSEHIRRLRPNPSKFHTLPSDYRNLLTNWGLSSSESNTWIHNVNAASPLKPFYSHNQESARNGHLSPLHFPSSHNNYP